MIHQSTPAADRTHPLPHPDSFPLPVWTSSEDGTILYANAAWREYFGAPVAGERWLDRVHTDDLARQTEARPVDDAISTACRLRLEDGRYGWFRVTHAPLPSRDGAPGDGAWQHVACDIQSDKDREQALRAAQRIQKDMVDASIDCIKVITPSGHLVDMNRSGCEALGVSPDSGFGMEWLPLLPADVRAPGLAALEAAREGQVARFQGRSVLPNEPPRLWDNVLTPVLDAEGRPHTMLCLSRDVTEQRRLEEQLRKTTVDLELRVEAHAAELARVWRTSPDLLLVAAPDGTILRTNPSWRDILGYGPEDLLGRHFLSFVSADDLEFARQLLAGEHGQSVLEVRHLHRAGSTRWVEWIATPGDGAICAVGRHVTDVREAEARLHAAETALRHAQKVEAIGRLTGSVAHDFNNLLSVMRNSLTLYQTRGLPEDQRARCLDVLTSTTDRAIALTRQLVDFARRTPPAPVEFSVDDRVAALESMLTMLLGARVRLDLRPAEHPCRVLADPTQFDTALLNLALNARDAMDGRGTLTIAFAPAAAAPASWRGETCEGPFVAVAVSDTGPGVPEHDLARIFEPFYTTKPDALGTGLGLAQVLGFVEQCEGAVEVTSTTGQGATFTLYLPAAEA